MPLLSTRNQKYILNTLVVIGFLFICSLFVRGLILVWTEFPIEELKKVKRYDENLAIFSTQIAISIILIWFMIFFPYLAWAVYFYNINMGRTNEEWESINKKNEERKKLNEPEIAPTNPYGEETFGLPKGTIRGSIAITLMVGALALFVIAVGHPTILRNNEFFNENFEFFKTAFLMMIAFYFGGKSLEYLQDRLKQPRTDTRRRSHAPEIKGGSDDEETFEQDNQADAENVVMDEDTDFDEQPLAPASPGKRQEHVFNTDVLSGEPSVVIDHHLVTKEYEVEKTKELTDEDIAEAAKANDVETAALKAVIEIESKGRGLYKDGRPKILFEGHIFWRKLKDRNIDPTAFAIKYPNIVYPTWVKTHYKLNEAEYERFKIASQIDAEAAKLSTSWGMFQIMGFNFGACGFKDVDDFVEKMSENEAEQMKAFVNFCNHHNLFAHLRNHDWASFARAYNGKDYKKNQYDYKLELKYHEFSNDLNDSLSVKVVREQQNDKQTIGTLTVYEDRHPLFSCKTLELPWKENKRNISCIPVSNGTPYKVEKRWTEQRHDHFHVLSVPGRSSILIHNGNYYFHTQGCILVGKEISDINKDGYVDVTESKATLSKLTQLLPKQFTLTIENSVA